MKKHLIIILIVIVAAFAAIFVIMDYASKRTQSAPTTSGAQLANPASVNCEKQGGNLVIKTNPSGGQYGVCYFEDNMACEEWALFRGDCPVGGVKTTGYDTMAQTYCAWVGGQTLAVSNAQCTLPDGTVCSDEELYNNGTCN